MLLSTPTKEDMPAVRPDHLDPEVPWKNWDYSLPASREAERDSNAVPALTVFHQRPLRTCSLPRFLKQPPAPTLFSRSQSAAASTQRYEHLPEDASITNHRTVEELRMLDWEKADQTITSACFLMWAVSVVLLGGWHVASQLSANVAQVAVAVLAATCTPVAFSRINRQAPDGVPSLVASGGWCE